MTKIKAITVDALGTGFFGISTSLLLIGANFDTAGAVVFAASSIIAVIGIAGIFVVGAASLIAD